MLRLHLNEEALEPLREFSLEMIDLALHTPVFIVFPYSMVAAAALFIRIQDDGLIWQCTGYRLDNMKTCVDWLWSFFRCPECIIYFHPEEAVDHEDFDSAIGNNYRVMNYLMVHDNAAW